MRDQPPRDASHRQGSGDHAHGKPPFEGAPGRALSSLRGRLEHVVEVVGEARPERALRGARGAVVRCGRRRSCELPSRDRRCRGRPRRRRSPRASRRATGGAGTWRSRSGSRVPRPRRAAASRGSSAGRRRRAARAGGAGAPGRAARGRRRPPTMSATAGRVDRRQLHLDRPATAPSQDIDTGTGDETAEPALEAIRIAKGRQVLPGSDEALLDRVSREFLVPEDEAGRRVQPRDEHAGKHGEGVMIAPLRSLDEFSLVHGPPVCRRGGFVALGW